MVEGEEYEGTPGLWELIVSKKPDKFIYTSEDEENYKRLMLKTNSLYVGNNPEKRKKKKSSKGDKWNNILSKFWKDIKKEGELLLFRVILTH